MNPLSFVKDAIEIQNLLHSKSKKRSYDSKFENSYDVLFDNISRHAITLYSLSQGIQFNLFGRNMWLYDSITARYVFRSMMENYMTLILIYDNPKSESEKEAKFLLWCIEGVKSYNQIKLDCKYLSPDLVIDDRIESLKEKLFANEFYKAQSEQIQKKLYKVNNRGKEIFNWKFFYNRKNEIIVGSISDCIELLISEFFKDLYKETSWYVHSSFPSIEEMVRKDNLYNNNQEAEIGKLISLNHSSFNIMCLSIGILLKHNPNLVEEFEEIRKSNTLFSDRYKGALKYFGKEDSDIQK